jgi:N-acetylglucosaminyl-diphospho-decaprenol L-rhamnosyltransferase
MTHDLAIIIVSTNEARWLTPCLSTIFERAGDVELDVVVVDNESTDGTRELVEREFPQARVVRSENRGFSYANNGGLLTTDARYVLFLNPDTEILAGTFEELVRALDDRPQVGLAGARQVTADGALFPTIRHFPNALRLLGDAVGAERLPRRPNWLGERELDLARYDEELECDWTSGSFLCARREALESAGYLDERFFIYSEETDLCLRIKRAGWQVRHLPSMTILHHAEKAGINPKMIAQDVFTRMQYSRKHYSPVHRGIYLAILALRYATRVVPVGAAGSDRSAAARRALRTLFRLDPPPFGPPPRQSLTPRPPVEAPAKLRRVSSGG